MCGADVLGPQVTTDLRSGGRHGIWEEVHCDGHMLNYGVTALLCNETSDDVLDLAVVVATLRTAAGQLGAVGLRVTYWRLATAFGQG